MESRPSAHLVHVDKAGILAWSNLTVNVSFLRFNNVMPEPSNAHTGDWDIQCTKGNVLPYSMAIEDNNVELNSLDSLA